MNTIFKKGMKTRKAVLGANYLNAVKKNITNLYFRNTILVYIKINKKKIFSDQWIYLHSKNLNVGRITNFSNWNSKINKKSKETILCMEFWCYNKDIIWIKELRIFFLSYIYPLKFQKNNL